ncbi:MAG: sulfotransferase family protein [Candidatus Nanopelagicales bacterium]
MADGVYVDGFVATVYRPDVQSEVGGDGIVGFAARLPDYLLTAASSVLLAFEDGARLEGGTLKGAEGLSSSLRAVDVEAEEREEAPGGVVYLHIPRTAGTSIRAVFEARYGDDEIVYVYPDPPGVPRSHLLNLSLSQRARLRCVYGHDYFGAHTLLPGHWKYATVLREPIARVVSNFQHACRFRPQDVGGRSLRDVIHAGTEVEFDNYMVRVIAGAAPPDAPIGTIDSDSLEVALEHVDEGFTFVGFAERVSGIERGLADLLTVASNPLPFVGHSSDGSESVTQADLDAAREASVWDEELYWRLFQDSLGAASATTLPISSTGE